MAETIDEIMSVTKGWNLTRGPLKDWFKTNVTGAGYASIHPYTSFAYNTSSLASGISTGITVASGDVLLAIHLDVTTSFDGTTPLFDLGVGVSNGGAGVTGGTSIASASTTRGGAVVLTTKGPYLFTSSGAIEYWVSQDGTKNGTAIGGTQGAAKFSLLIGTPS